MAVEAKAHTSRGGLSHWVPGIGHLRSYRRQWLTFDVAAGLALGAILVPKGIAYAELAGLPAVTGLYATIAALVAYAIFGPSRVLVLGPDSSVSPLIFAAVVPLVAVSDPATAIALAGMLALMVGVIEICLGLGKLGFVADLLSQEVQVGYMNGLAIIIILDLVPKLFGVHTEASGSLNKAQAFFAEVAATNHVSLAIGICTLAVLLGFPLLTRRIPAVILGVGGALLVTAVFGLTDYGVQTIGVLPQGFPTPSLPTVAVKDLVPLAIAAFGIVLVSLTDTIATSASFAARRGDEVDANQEIIGVGVANIVNGFVQGFPVSVSGSRTAVATQSGAKSQVTNLVGAALLLALLLFVPGLLKDLPQPALAAVVIAAAIGLADLGALRTYWRVRPSSLAISLGATGGVVLFGVLNGILIAVGIAVILFFKRSWWPPGEVLAYDSALDDWHSAQRLPSGAQAPGILVYRWEAPLFFANARIFRQQIRKLVVQQTPEWIVLQCEAITDIDVTAASTLKDLAAELKAKGIHFAFVGMRDRLKDLMLDYGLFETLDSEHFYPSVKRALAAMERSRKASSVFLCAPVSALEEGIFRQHIPLKTIREHGDFAAGTFDDLDGEMVMLDGRTFQLTTGGRVLEVGDEATTPFACVTYFEPISHDDLSAELDYHDFRTWIQDLLPSPNLVYALRIEGTFAEVTVSARSRRETPMPATEAAAPQEPQDVVTFREVTGVLAGFFTPAYLKSLNTPGLHLNFLSTDRSQGGHLVACRPREVRAQVQFVTLVELGLPMRLGYLTWTFDEDTGAYVEDDQE
jgi:alpha-acetolactate decarboxylase